MVFLTVNAGSSSVKVSVFDEAALHTPITSVSVEDIGTSETHLIPQGVYGSPETHTITAPTHLEAVTAIIEWLERNQSIAATAVQTIGHRVVHGGLRHTTPEIITPALLHDLEAVTPLAPNHTPATLATITAFFKHFPGIPQVACFDTSFFNDIPLVARMLPLPLTLQQEKGIQRYGFHGLSYESLLKSFEKHEGTTAARGRVIMAHLGSGASVAACKNGAPVDMSMGFTPVSGIMMSTRSGDLEPGVITYLQEQSGLSAAEIATLVTHKSGLLGVSGLSGDMHTLLEAQHTNAHAKLAIDLFCYKIKKQIGAYAAVLGGVDSLIFSGGIGERSAEIRQRICSDLGFLGIVLDEEKNNTHSRLISAPHAGAGVHVIHAQEDSSIIAQLITVINNKEPS